MTSIWNYSAYGTGDTAFAGIPQARWCFDSEAVHERLSTAWPGPSVAGTGRVIDVYYRPGKAIDVCHAFLQADGRELVVTLHCSPPERGGHDYRKALKQAEAQAQVLVIDDSTFAWMFPEDASLQHLPALLHDAGYSPRMLSYRRGTRCTLLDCDRNEIVKLHAGADDSQRRLASFFNNPARRFAMAAPLGCDSTGFVRRERFVPGIGFAQHAADVGIGAGVRAILQALVAMHETPVDDLKTFTAAKMLERYTTMFLRRLGDTRDTVMVKCQRLGAMLAERIPDQTLPPVTLHGDMHMGNVLFNSAAAGGVGVTLIDLDEAVRGDPEYDLAILASSLVLMAALQPDSARAALATACAIPALYELEGGHAVAAERFRWYFAAAIASRQIKRCISHCAPHCDQLTEQLANAALAVMQASVPEPDAIAHAMALQAMELQDA